MNEPRPEPAPRAWLQSIANAILGRLAWLLGAPMLVVGCGFLVMWWSLYQERDVLISIQARTTQTVQARLVDRYYHVRPTDLDARPSRASCYDTCRIEMDSVAVFEFALPDGRMQRVQFDTWAHDWQHNTDFELGLPLIGADFVVDPAFRAQLQAEAAWSDPAKTIWQLFWDPTDDAGHWLLRLRDPVPAFVAPLRYDPDDPAIAVLDLPRFAQAQADERGDLDSVVFVLLFFVGIVCIMVLGPAVHLMLLGVSRRIAIAVTFAICISVPLWAPYATRIAPWLSDEAGELAEGMAREFAAKSPPNYVSGPVTDRDRLELLRWELPTSSQAAFLAGLDTRLPAQIDPLDHAGAYEALQSSFDHQLRTMPPQAAAGILKQLRHHEAVTLWELFVPALLRIAADASSPEAQRSDALDLLRFFAQDWPMPDVDVFLYRHRLDNYARLRAAPDAAIRDVAATRLREAEARLEVQRAPG